jgi:hypothetical protein
MFYYKKFNDDELLEIQLMALQQTLPKKVIFRGKKRVLSEKERRACGRAIWYIVKKGYGINSAVQRASGSFNCSASKVDRAVRPVFPPTYFEELEKSKNIIFLRSLEEAEQDEKD